MIRVLFVDHATALGGAEHSLLLLLKHLDRYQFSPVLGCREGPLADGARQCGVPVELVAMPRLRSLAAPGRLLSGAMALARVVRRYDIDMVQCNTMRASLYAALAARWTRRPLVWHVRDIYAPGRYVRWMTRRATRVLAVSEAAAAPIRELAEVQVVPNGVELEVFRHSDVAGRSVRDELNIPTNVPLVGMLGRLEPWKGQADFVRAMSLARSHHPEARYVVAGGAIFGARDAYLSGLRDLAAAMGLGAAVVFAGQRNDVPAVLSALDVLVHCSTEPEPFGRVLIEAMAAGLPVVAYDAGGVGEIVIHGETGLLCPLGDTRALGEAVSTLLADPGRARRMGRAGRERAEAHYDAKQHARRVEAVLCASVER